MLLSYNMYKIILYITESFVRIKYLYPSGTTVQCDRSRLTRCTLFSSPLATIPSRRSMTGSDPTMRRRCTQCDHTYLTQWFSYILPKGPLQLKRVVCWVSKANLCHNSGEGLNPQAKCAGISPCKSYINCHVIYGS